MTSLNTLADHLGKRYSDIMDADPLTLVPDDINTIIEYHRKNRAEGLKPKKDLGPAPKLDITALGLGAPKPTGPEMKRRF